MLNFEFIFRFLQRKHSNMITRIDSMRSWIERWTSTVQFLLYFYLNVFLLSFIFINLKIWCYIHQKNS